jgi:hypothetical protein
MRSIPPRTHSTLAREGKLVSVARDLNKQPSSQLNKSTTIKPIKRGTMRKLLSVEPFTQKLKQLQSDLNDLINFAEEGLDISKAKTDLENQIKNLELFMSRGMK